MYMTPLCWENWVSRFQAAGYECFAPAWPGRDKPIEVQRKNHPDPELGKLTLFDVLGSMETRIKTLKEKPILIGHSMGALATQLLVQRGLASAGVAIDSAPPAGVFTPKWSFLKSNWPHITPFVSIHRPIEMTFERFQYSFVNTRPLAEQRAAFERYVVPESRGVPRESLTANIDFKKPHVPLLIVAGSNDRIIPASLNKANFARYSDPGSITDYREFDGRTHFIIGQPGWQEVADYVISWLNAQDV